MFRHFLSLSATILIAMIIMGCGGINSNPTQPGFQNPQQQTPPGKGGAGAPGSPDDLFNQLSGGGAQAEESVIAGTYETLYPKGIENVANGQMMLAGQYFKSAFAQNPQSADAALAYAITDVMRDYRRFSVFLHPGVDRLFMNTPLIGHPEAFPNPFLAADSYFLRLTALGRRSSKLVNTVKYPTLSLIDSEVMFTPSNFERFKNMKMGPAASPGGTGPAGPSTPGSTPVPPVPGTPGSPSGDGSTTLPPDHMTPGSGVGGTVGIEAKHKQSTGAGGLAGAGTGLIRGDTNKSGVTTPPKVNDSNQMTTPLPTPTPTQKLPEREGPLTEEEWGTLLKEYRDSSLRDGADIFLSSYFYNSLKQLHDDIKEHIANLEAVRTITEAPGYTLALSMDVTDGTSIITFSFDVDDYHMILDHFRLLDSLLTYVETYNTQVSLLLPTEAAKDSNSDNVLSPDEYLPQAPFGTLKPDDVENLKGQLPIFIQALNGLSNTMRPLLDDAQKVQAGDPEKKEVFYLSSFHTNYAPLDQWVKSIKDIADKSTSGTAIKLDTATGLVDAVAVYDALFNSPLMDIRTPLPNYDAVTFEVKPTDSGKWSTDPTLGGFFSEGLTDAATYSRSGKLICIVYDDKMAKAGGDKMVVGLKSGDVAENGFVGIDDVTVNELVGTPYKITDKGGAELGKGTIATLSEVIPLFDIGILTNILNPTIGGLTTNGGPGGSTMMGPGATAPGASGPGGTGPINPAPGNPTSPTGPMNPTNPGGTTPGT
jgi:hypothetical protein